MNRTASFLIGALVAAIICVPIGMWMGGEREQNAFINTIRSIDLSDQCLAELSRGVDERLRE